MERVVADAVQAGLDGGLLVTPGPDLVWLTGYQPTAITERLTVLALRPGHEPTLLVPLLERPDAEAAAGAAALTIRDWTDGSDPYAVAGELLDPGGSYAVSDSAWSMHLLGLQESLPGTRYRAMTQCLPMLRAVKDDNELARLAAAGAAADATFQEILGVRFAGRRESEVAADLAALLRQFGHEQVDFTVVGSGPNGANPHHEAGERVIEVGDAVVLDFGGLMSGYGSDTTRTVCVGEPSAELLRVHGVVRAAQQAAFEAVRPGVACQEIDRVARSVITAAGYGEQFIHRTGHGIGVTTHEPPYMVEGELQPLKPGMCFSIEPGIYLSGHFGVRIEDIVTVTADGGRRLNTTDHGLAVVS
jgi:D-alanyl-D-alanine dipeptidase